MTLDQVFRFLVQLYTVSNMASIGLELNLRETMRSLRNVLFSLKTHREVFASAAHEGEEETPWPGLALATLAWMRVKLTKIEWQSEWLPLGSHESQRAFSRPEAAESCFGEPWRLQAATPSTRIVKDIPLTWRACLAGVTVLVTLYLLPPRIP
jgi:hypothetical protein